MSIVRFLFQTFDKTLKSNGVNSLVSFIFFLLIGQGLLAQTQIGSDIKDNENGIYSQYFGWSVASSSNGSIVAVGSTGHDTGAPDFYSNTGVVRIYEYSGGSWSPCTLANLRSSIRHKIGISRPTSLTNVILSI